MTYNTIQKPLSELFEDPKNARLHPDKNLEAIVASLNEFGQVEPLIVRKETGVVIGGNGRLACMKALGWEEASVVEVDIDEQKANALSVALNRTGELAEWDEQKLSTLLTEIGEGGDLSFTGFDEKDLSSLMGPLKPGLDAFVKDEPEAPKEKPVPTGDGSWFYVEFYGEDERFAELKVKLEEHMTGLHEIEPAFFENLITEWAKSQADG